MTNEDSPTHVTDDEKIPLKSIPLLFRQPAIIFFLAGLLGGVVMNFSYVLAYFSGTLSRIDYALMWLYGPVPISGILGGLLIIPYSSKLYKQISPGCALFSVGMLIGFYVLGLLYYGNAGDFIILVVMIIAFVVTLSTLSLSSQFRVSEQNRPLVSTIFISVFVIGGLSQLVNSWLVNLLRDSGLFESILTP